MNKDAALDRFFCGAGHPRLDDGEVYSRAAIAWGMSEDELRDVAAFFSVPSVQTPIEVIGVWWRHPEFSPVGPFFDPPPGLRARREQPANGWLRRLLTSLGFLK